MHINGFMKGKGKFVLTEYVPTDEKSGPRYPLLLTTGRILSHYNVGAQTRRTANVAWHEEDRLEIHPHDAEQRGVKDGDWVQVASRAGETTLRALVTDRVAPGVVYTTFHHPIDPGQCRHDGFLRLGDQLSGIQGHGRANLALEWPDRLAGAVSRTGGAEPPHRRGSRSRGMNEDLYGGGSTAAAVAQRSLPRVAERRDVGCGARGARRDGDRLHL